MITKVTLANDLYGVVPKGSQPTFKLVAGQVQVDTPLTLLNSTVQAPKWLTKLSQNKQQRKLRKNQTNILGIPPLQNRIILFPNRLPQVF